MSWKDIGALEDIPVRGARRVKTGTGCIAVFRTGEDEVFATANTCQHLGGPLHDGIVHDRKITCPLHNWVYSLETGEVVAGGEGQIATYPVRVENGRVLLDSAQVAPTEHA